jgi:pyruvate dehydrogenase E1 component alpha subunit
MAELFGKKTGCCRGQGGSMHIFSQKHGVLGGYAFIGEGIPIGVGAAFQSAYRWEESAAVVAIPGMGGGAGRVGRCGHRQAEEGRGVMR